MKTIFILLIILFGIIWFVIIIPSLLLIKNFNKNTVNNECSPQCVSPEKCIDGICQKSSGCSPECVLPNICVGGICQKSSGCSPECVLPNICVGGICKDNIIGFDDINNKFKTTPGILVVMNQYKLDESSQKKQIYLENNVFDSNDGSEKIIATTYLTERLPLGVYATRGQNTTIGIILDPTLIYDNNWIKCMQVTDANSVNRACNVNGKGGNPGYPCSCKDGVDCKSSTDYKAVQAGCGVFCWDTNKKCNTVDWCSNYDNDTIINNYKNRIWNGVGANCMFKPPPNDLFVNAAIAWRKSQPNGPESGNYWLETELDGTIDITDDNKNLWLKSIIGIFHTSDPGYMCSCMYCGDDNKSYCCNDDQNIQLICQNKYCKIDECQRLSKQTVKNMVDEYNTNVSDKTGHKIKAWSLKNITRHKWNGWDSSTNYIVNLSDFLVEL